MAAFTNLGYLTHDAIKYHDILHPLVYVFELFVDGAVNRFNLRYSLKLQLTAMSTTHREMHVREKGLYLVCVTSPLSAPTLL